jgi:hypothetical protein
VRIPKGLWTLFVYKKVNSLEVRILKSLEGPLGGHPCLYGRQEPCRLNETIIAHKYFLSIVTCKWFVCCGMAVRGSLRDAGQAGETEFRMAR